MKEYCRGCVHHHNAGHPKTSNLVKKYNDWCCKAGRTAYKSIGACKLNDWRLIEVENNEKV